MTEKKVATPEIARATWEAMDNPSVRRVEEKLKAAGYVTPSYKTINKWQAAAKAAGKPWATKTVKTGRPNKMRQARQMLDDATPALTGDPRSKAEDVIEAIKALPPPDQKADDPKAEGTEEPKSKGQQFQDEVFGRLKQLHDAISGETVTDEIILTKAARETLITATLLECVLGAYAHVMVPQNPEGVGKMQLAVATSLAAAGEPYDRVGRARELAMKTIGGNGAMNGEIIMPGAGDPLADSLAAFKKKHAA